MAIVVWAKRRAFCKRNQNQRTKFWILALNRFVMIRTASTTNNIYWGQLLWPEAWSLKQPHGGWWIDRALPDNFYPSRNGAPSSSFPWPPSPILWYSGILNYASILSPFNLLNFVHTSACNTTPQSCLMVVWAAIQNLISKIDFLFFVTAASIMLHWHARSSSKLTSLY